MPDLKKKLRLESPRIYFDTNLAGHDYTTRRKPSTYIRLVVKQRNSTNVQVAQFTQLLFARIEESHCGASQ